MNWSFDDEDSFWQVYSDEYSIALPRWMPVFVPRWLARFLRLAWPIPRRRWYQAERK